MIKIVKENDVDTCVIGSKGVFLGRAVAIVTSIIIITHGYY